MIGITYTRKDIIRKVSNQLDLGNKEVKIILDEILDTMTGIFLEKHSILRLELRNFGVFEIKPTKANPKARNPRTNEIIYVPPHRKIQFKAGKILRKELKKEYQINK
ncbi:MAG: DNA-binding protein [Candidatus Marinimicrobia bacterium]|nr:DNA-binding protein [Candidatus Neomarinimicrobiota bacterium]|tara:strand:+ start:878 stop:1198 length:321 start_codon:yes stop_codon:yes gene_type:complete